jgi:hypothetical protein
MMILKWMLKKQDELIWTASMFQDRKKAVDFCQNGNEHISSIKGREFWNSWGIVSLSKGLCCMD